MTGKPQSVCRNGLHALEGDNLVVRPNGTRRCRACEQAAERRRHARDRDKRNAASMRRYNANRDEINRRRRAANHGLTLEEYDAILKRQDGRCAVCRTADPGGKWNTALMVDHDHETGEVRGMLCARCNLAIGQAQDDPARLRALADYLEGRGR